jgi:hypothetical protein
VPLSATEAVSPAIEHAKKQLFQPFRFWQWTRLAFVGLLTAEASSGGGCNAPGNFPGAGKGGSGGVPDMGPFHKILDIWHAHPLLIVGLITAAIVACFVLWVLLIYVVSRMRFVLFDSIITKECHIREYWSRRRLPAWNYFLWNLGFAVLSTVAIVILIGIPLALLWSGGLLRKPGQHILALVLTGILVFVLMMAYTICVAVIRVLTKDFVVPYMVVEGVSTVEGWRRFWPRMKAELGSYAGYIGMKIVLAIAAGIIFGIITALVIGIPIVFVVMAGVLIGVGAAGAGLTWNAFTITLVVVVGIIGFVIVVYLAALINVPGVVFFPAHGIHFLASRYPGLDALLHPAPPAPAVPEIPPPMPPPLPPEPNAFGS